jgi:tellurium resistance protein TerD
MGIFNIFKTAKDIPSDAASIPTTNTVQTPGILNLQKNQILNLTKVAPQLVKMRVAAGWDVVTRGRDYDLDLCAILLGADGKAVSSCNSLVYYGKKDSTGIYLDGDNLTGEGDGDDENIYVTLSDIPMDVQTILFCVVIYDAHARKQKFKNVRNAYVRIVNETNGETEVCRYNLTEDGGENTAVMFAELYKDGNEWNFKAIGKYLNASIQDIRNLY